MVFPSLLFPEGILRGIPVFIVSRGYITWYSRLYCFQRVYYVVFPSLLFPEGILPGIHVFTGAGNDSAVGLRWKKI